ncbi:DUF2690 domain-containing protein [Pseudoclavibacter terrae]|uniref:DUF2690 domain-containing protein n=1 Tax=Pseudoclavibacter terrae TaxID=1530195 RepID=UPI00232F1A94|nr:DUF2690 domain-containing protein [Pseudoclavibacter terrae]
MSDIRDSPARFASDLQSLREQAGRPTIVRLAESAGISKSVVGDALGGNRLPTAKTVERLVTALGADPAPWLERRSELVAPPRVELPPATIEQTEDGPTPVESGTQNASAEARLPTSEAPTPLPPPITKRRLVSTAAAAALVSAAVTSGVWFGVGQLQTADDPFASISDGFDPMQTVCRDDAVVAASEMRERETQVQLMYSTSCKAVWGRVTRYDGEAAGNELTMSVYPAVDRDSERRQSVSAYDVQSVYTPLGTSPETSERWCGLATMTADGQTIDLGPELCI